MKNLLAKNRARLNKELQTYEARRFLSSLTYRDSLLIEHYINKYAYGKLIDIGCGDIPYAEICRYKTTQFDTLDIQRYYSCVTLIADIQNIPIITNSIYDCVICISVLEHVENPFQAISEIHRILKKGGTLILSVPHISRLHCEPYDFFRFTKYALRSLLKNYGFRIIEIEPNGGIISFLGHQISTFFVCLFWHIPILKKMIFLINKYLFVKIFSFLDNIFDKEKIFATGYVCISKKE